MDVKEFNKGLKPMVTPRGVAVFPWLSRAKTKVGDKTIDPTYTTDLRLDPQNEEHAEFLAALTHVCDEGKSLLTKKKQKEFRYPFSDEVEKDTDEDTGFILLKVKTYATDKEGNKKKLTIVDAKKRAVNDPVFGGSELKLIIKPSLYSGGVGHGVTLYLNAVQVLKLVTTGGADLSMFGDDDGEGYEAPADFADNESSTDAAPDGDDSDY